VKSCLVTGKAPETGLFRQCRLTWREGGPRIPVDRDIRLRRGSAERGNLEAREELGALRSPGVSLGRAGETSLAIERDHAGQAALLSSSKSMRRASLSPRPWFNSVQERAAVKGAVVKKRLVTRYAMRSAEAANENQRRVEGVFDELAADRPDSVSYIVLRLADDSFVHVSFHNHGDDEVNPIASTAAFAHFQDDHADRREGGVDQQTAELVGAYITTIG
jgi:hypothetical protein